MGDRDRRVVDPPPILQLSLKDYNPRSPGDVDALRTPFYVLACTLLDSSGSDITQAKDTRDERMTRGLTGTLHASPFAGMDPDVPPSKVENARLACFFIFPDISCRQPGRYRLRFTLASQVVEGLPTGSTSPILGVVESDVLEVFTAKDFPGMRPSTTLTKDLRRQGASCSVKQGKKPKAKGQGQKRGSDVSGEDASERSQDTLTRRRRH